MLVETEDLVKAYLTPFPGITLKSDIAFDDRNKKLKVKVKNLTGLQWR